jgi:hypothetical protein
MDIVLTIGSTVIEQLQKPTLAFLIAGVLLAALGSKFEIPEPVYKFIVILLLLKVGIGAGIRSVMLISCRFLSLPLVLPLSGSRLS